MRKQTIRDILAANLQRIREARTPRGEDLMSGRAFSLLIGFESESDVRLINRILNGVYDVKLDTLVKIADTLGLQPWQLLLEDFDPEHPQTQPMTAEEKQTLDNLRILLKRE